jgi:membrane protease YdiL (CAAX protease family)
MIGVVVAAGQRVNGRLVAWSALVLVVGGLGFATRFLPSDKPARTPIFFTWSLGFGGVLQYAIMLGLTLWIAAGLSRRETFALRPPDSIVRAIRIALGAGAVAAIVSGIAGPLLNPAKEQGILPEHGWVPGHVAPFVFSVIVVAGVAPVVEELLFRGLGFSLLARYGRWVAIVGVGVAFAIAHGLPRALPVLIPFGAALAYLRDRTGSVYPGMVVHALFNGVAIAIAVA